MPPPRPRRVRKQQLGEVGSMFTLFAQAAAIIPQSFEAANQPFLESWGCEGEIVFSCQASSLFLLCLRLHLPVGLGLGLQFVLVPFSTPPMLTFSTWAQRCSCRARLSLVAGLLPSQPPAGLWASKLPSSVAISTTNLFCGPWLRWTQPLLRVVRVGVRLNAPPSPSLTPPLPPPSPPLLLPAIYPLPGGLPGPDDGLSTGPGSGANVGLVPLPPPPQPPQPPSLRSSPRALLGPGITDFKDELRDVKQKTLENEKKIGKLEEGAVGMGKEVGKVQKGCAEAENQMTKLDLDRMSFFLRFQNVVEEEGEDLKDIMSKILAELIQKKEEHLRWDIDQVYRVNSNYAKTHNVPREVHVRFLRSATRDGVLRAQRERTLTYKEQEVTILKQIPKKIREKRKKYAFLSQRLYNKRILFRWLLPEGLLIFWKGNKIRINNTTEAEAFMTENRSLLEEEDLGAAGKNETLYTSTTGGTTAPAKDERAGAIPKNSDHMIKNSKNFLSRYSLKVLEYVVESVNL